MIYADLLDESALNEYARAINARATRCDARGRVDVASLRHRILECGGHCEWCGVKLVGQPFEIDHIISLSAGGSNTAPNLVVSCVRCNRQKSDKHPARFAAEIAVATGSHTDFTRRLIAHYGGDIATQPRLFDDDASE
ncbi:MAG: HNH endonuclease [Anaerolineaceae bacterium]|nr:MAG: HNH endonuclease [Anaerolineaceae bacterium]